LIRIKKSIIEKYNEIAHRDAQILIRFYFDFDENSINVFIEELKKGINISLEISIGLEIKNILSGLLDTILGIKKGDLYNQTSLETKLFMNPNGNDISSYTWTMDICFFK
jgi:hypothetical protein